MKRYLLFEYDNYYPYGGWADFQGSFDTLEEALGARIRVSKDSFRFDNCQIIDITTGEDVS